jgi:hypothetical protein
MRHMLSMTFFLVVQRCERDASAPLCYAQHDVLYYSDNNQQLSINNYQSTTINQQPSINNHQLTTINQQTINTIYQSTTIN